MPPSHECDKAALTAKAQVPHAPPPPPLQLVVEAEGVWHILLDGLNGHCQSRACQWPDSSSVWRPDSREIIGGPGGQGK